MIYYKQRLIKRIEKEFGLKIISINSFVSNYLSYGDRSAGFACWNAEATTCWVGSHNTIKQCATAKILNGGMVDGDTFMITVEK